MHVNLRNPTQVLRYFGSVIFLTQSNWFTEPRSNRYHYATRFAKHLPVIFVQFDKQGLGTSVETTDVNGLTILHAPRAAAPDSITDEVSRTALNSVVQAINHCGGHRPLVWAYNPYCGPLINAINPIFAVYHATEIYLSNSEFRNSGRPYWLEYFENCIYNLSNTVELIFAVSDGVCDSFSASRVPRDKIIPNYNGVDTNFWSQFGKTPHKSASSGRPVVLYQGGVNNRLDFDLILNVCRLMHDWDFWFFGNVNTQDEAWEKIKKLTNVKVFGSVPLEYLGNKTVCADVAWVPFINTPYLYTSFPLKIYEYVACGLPVVSRPIQALKNSEPVICRFADNVSAFKSEIEAAKLTRSNVTALKLREEHAFANSYDKKFELALSHINRKIGLKNRKASILILYDDRYRLYSETEFHLRSFGKYSQNHVFYAPVSAFFDTTTGYGMFTRDMARDFPALPGSPWDFSAYDAILIHSSLRTNCEGRISNFLVDCLARFVGPKILFIQDEYDHVEMTRSYIRRMGVTDIFTCVPDGGQNYVYPQDKLPKINFIRTHEGYAPEEIPFSEYALPLRDRPIMIGYRGQKRPHYYGAAGYEEMVIGQRMKSAAGARKLPIDIEMEESQKSNDDWYSFLGTCRATLGTEYNRSIIDFDGRLQKKSLEFSHLPYDEIYDREFKTYETPFSISQISPKIFEAISLRTALMCFPGDYAGVLRPSVHYIKIEKDFSNLDEVFEQLADDDIIEKMTNRAFEDIIAPGYYSYSRFVSNFDDWLDGRLLIGGTEIIMAPIAVRRGDRVTAIQRPNSHDYTVTSIPLVGRTRLKNFQAKFAPSAAPLADWLALKAIASFSRLGVRTRFARFRRIAKEFFRVHVARRVRRPGAR